MGPFLFTGLQNETTAGGITEKYLHGMTVYGWDYLQYQFDRWVNSFAEYPFVIQVSLLVVSISLFTILLMLCRIVYIHFYRLRHKRFYNKIFKLYYEPLYTQLTSQQDLPVPVLASNINYQAQKWKKWQMAEWIKLCLRLKSHIIHPSEFNFRTLITLIGLEEFVENTLHYGWLKNERLPLVQVALFLNLKISESTLVRLLDNENRDLRKAVRILNMAVNEDDPFRFIREDTKMDYRALDILEFHQILHERSIKGKKMPNFAPLLDYVRDINTKTLIISETAYWGSDSDMIYLKKFFHSSELKYRKAAFESIGIRRFESAEEELKEIYNDQPSHLKREILHTLLKIRSGRSAEFFRQAYLNASTSKLKQTALSCLFQYNERSKEYFHQLKSQAQEEDRPFFFHVQNVLLASEA